MFKRAVIIRRALVPIWVVNSFLVRRKPTLQGQGKLPRLSKSPRQSILRAYWNYSLRVKLKMSLIFILTELCSAELFFSYKSKSDFLVEY